MGQSAVAISEKIMHLSDEQPVKVDHFVEALQLSEHATLTEGSMTLSERPFEAVWNNPEDDAYNAS